MTLADCQPVLHAYFRRRPASVPTLRAACRRASCAAYRFAGAMGACSYHQEGHMPAVLPRVMPTRLMEGPNAQLPGFLSLLLGATGWAL